ncbi:site-specific integrase [Thioalkalivibrio sp. ALE20]|uniref:tyrosine-type recombinase/integrase n=1 Tax=Thioalkalivibrio sp. ALE20 TaxID=545275 RepID=UPI00036E7A6D|nr:site-specific integrase [Thioalkalivibrio sp. ALE20]
MESDSSSGEKVLDLVGLLEHYLSVRILRPETIDRYRQVVRQFHSDVGPLTLDRIDEPILLHWRDQVLGRARATTWNYYRRHFRALWRHALDYGWVHQNPLERVSGAPEARRIKTVSKELIERALAVLQDPAQRRLEPRWFWEILILTFYYTGMRRRQAAGLLWQDIRWSERTIRLREDGSKTRREWDVPITEGLERPLHDLYSRTLWVVGERQMPERQVFDLGLHRGPARYQGPGIDASQISYFFRRLGESLGEPISPHRLRHTFGTFIGRQPNPPLRALQHQLGHTNLSTTMQYVEPDMGQLRQMVDHLPTPGRS